MPQQTLEEKIGRDWMDFIPFFGVGNYLRRAEERVNYSGTILNAPGKYPEKVSTTQVMIVGVYIPTGVAATYALYKIADSLFFGR